MSGAVYQGRDLTNDDVIDCDVCIIGSGAGGAVLAAGLAESGKSVVILEAGNWKTRADFSMEESKSIPMLYQERGARATADRAITVLQGKSVGGGTTVNWTTCFRTPERILTHWAEHYGIPWTAQQLSPHFAAIEAKLNIHTWDLAAANANNRKLLAGCAKLGYEANPLKRNVRGCANSGYCGMGCPVNGKQSMHLTYIPDAVHAGARLYANTSAQSLVVKNDRVTEVHCSVRDEVTGHATGISLIVRPKLTVSSAGAINGPALLLRSGINDNGRVGKRTFLHPVIGVPSIYEEPVYPFYGAPQSIGSHHFADRGQDKIGFFLETAPLHPTLAASALQTFGPPAMEFMSHLSHTGILIALHVDGILEGDDGGTVSIKSDGRTTLDYPINSAMVEGFIASHQVLARISLAAGAREVRTMHSSPVIMHTESDLRALEDAPYGAMVHSIFSAHQMGGCAMGSDADTSVVNTNFQHHRIDNLFVVDGSIFPTSLGVNPSQSIYGLAHLARDIVQSAL